MAVRLLLHEMGFGLLSVFLPLYVMSETVQGSLVHIGILAATALFLAIPASFFWGYLCDRTKKYKRYILLCFVWSSIILYLFTMTTSVSLLIVLYAALSILHAAHEAPKNVLIAESYSRTDWERSFAFYEGFTETGWLIGLSVISTNKAIYMGISAFCDKKIRPSDEEIVNSLGSKFPLWLGMIQFIRETYPSQDEFKFQYGKNYGWAMKFDIKKQFLTALYPGIERFYAQLNLTPDAVERALQMNLGHNALTTIAGAFPYPEGRWFFIPVESENDISDIKILLALRVETKRLVRTS